jgi:hypothetical protein
VRASDKQPHWRVLNISAYESDLARLDAEVARRRAEASGRIDQATRSGVLRELIRLHLPEVGA